MHFHINHHLLRADIRALSARIRELKRVLGARWQRPMADLQREKCRLARRATELCALAAFARGRLHLRQPPRGSANDWSADLYHRAIAERLGPSYPPTSAGLPLALEQSA
jgi:hypothetical protein